MASVIVMSEIYECKGCGNKYNVEKQVENGDPASIYWEPSCPKCNTKITENVNYVYALNKY